LADRQGVALRQKPYGRGHQYKGYQAGISKLLSQFDVSGHLFDLVILLHRAFTIPFIL